MSIVFWSVCQRRCREKETRESRREKRRGKERRREERRGEERRREEGGKTRRRRAGHWRKMTQGWSRIGRAETVLERRGETRGDEFRGGGTRGRQDKINLEKIFFYFFE